MTLKQLKYLLGVVDHGLNITTAAERLYTSQPGISKQLRQLEQEVGVQLFSRKGKNLVGLTPAGAQVVEYARRILRDVDNIRNLGRELVAEDEGTLAIATTHTQARYVLPDVITAFHERYPRVQLELHQGTSEQIAALVADNRVDFAIATESRNAFPELNLLPIYSWDRIVLTPRDHPLARDPEPLTIEKLAQHPLITYVFSSRGESSFLQAFAKKNLEPKVVFTARDADVIKTYVKMGMGAGVLAPMALQCDELKELAAIDAKGLFPRVTTWLGVPRHRVFRRFMADFVALFAPHWPLELIERAATAESQEEVDRLAAGIDLPLRSGCTEGLSKAA
ncbi:MAG TPA: LysR substrate-binding domain-containing protein [Woeseiaceae bacterium]|nr:LysR substrate-binding domain-containing protein [Woeseiaceae bacterium]